RRTRPLLFGVATFSVLCGLLLACYEVNRCAPANASERQEKNEGAHRVRQVTNSLGMTLILVPAGEFLMGAPDSADLARKDEKPQHKVRISQSFYLGAHEVTVAQFRAFVKDTGFKTAAETDGKGASGYNAAWRGFEYKSDKYSWRNPGYRQDE